MSSSEHSTTTVKTFAPYTIVPIDDTKIIFPIDYVGDPSSQQTLPTILDNLYDNSLHSIVWGNSQNYIPGYLFGTYSSTGSTLMYCKEIVYSNPTTVFYVVIASADTTLMTDTTKYYVVKNTAIHTGVNVYHYVDSTWTSIEDIKFISTRQASPTSTILKQYLLATSTNTGSAEEAATITTGATGTGYLYIESPVLLYIPMILNCTASGKSAYAEGNQTIASGDQSHAEGSSTTASGDCSHAEGDSTKASGYCSHTEGFATKASGIQSHAEGLGSTASGEYAHAEGWNTIASKSYSHAEGQHTTASGWESHAECNYTTASGNESHAEGNYTTAAGESSHAEGNYTTANEFASHAEGKYNVGNTDSISEIGIGDYTAKKNAREWKTNGDYYVYGVGGYNGTNYSASQTLQSVVNNTIANLGIDAFDTTKAYAIGDVVMYNYRMYRFTAAHAAGAWLGTDAELWSISSKITSVESEVQAANEQIVTLTTAIGG